MKKTVRIAVLIIGLAGLFVLATVPQVAALDGGPIPTHPTTALDGGPIPTHPGTALDGGPIPTHPGTALDGGPIPTHPGLK